MANNLKKLKKLGGDKAIAGLAGAAAMAAGSEAYAQIIVRPPPPNLPNAASPATNPATGNIPWDFDGDSVNDFGFQFRNPQSATQVKWQANIFNLVLNNGTDGYVGPYILYAVRLSAGAVIGGTAPAGYRMQASTPIPAQAGSWQPAAGTAGTQVTLGSRYGNLLYGGFTNLAGTEARGFLGVRFLIGGQMKYGWIDVGVRPATTAAGSGGIFFYGAAYESSGGPIAAGAIPEPGTLAMLALGAAGILGRRRKA